MIVSKHSSQVRTINKLIYLLTPVLVLSLLFFTIWEVEHAESDLRRNFLTQAKLATAVNIERIKSLYGDGRDLDNINYHELKEQLATIRRSNERFRFIYLLGKNADGKVFFFVDSEDPDSKDFSPPGQIYAEAHREIYNAFTNMRDTVVGPISDRWGKWISALVPVVDNNKSFHTKLSLNTSSSFVRKAREYYREFGKEKLLKELNNPSGLFRHEDIYAFAYDTNMTMLAHPVKHELVGQNLITKPDIPHGKLFRLEMQRVALESGSGWVDYQYENPINGKIMQKTTYLEKVDDMIICCGNYKGTGDMVALLSVDIPYDVWQKEFLARAGLPVVMMFAIALMLSFFLLLYRSRLLIREKENKYRVLFEESMDAYFLIKSNKIIDCNDSMNKLFEMTKDELIGKTPVDISPEYQACGTPSSIKAQLMIEQALKTGYHKFEWIHQKADGTQFEMDVQLCTININGDDILFSSCRDVSDKKEVERKLIHSEQNFRNFFATIDDMIFIADVEGKVFYTNSAVENKLGYSCSEIKKMHVLDFHQPNSRAEAERIFADMFDGKLDICPLPLMKKNGETIPVETRIWFGDWDGRNCIFGISKDISKEEEARLMFNKLFESNPVPLALSLLPERVFVEVNSAFTKATGYAKEEVIGKTAQELNLFLDFEAQHDISMNLEESGSFKSIELKYLNKNGETFDGLFNGELINIKDNKYFLTSMVDLSAQKNAESALRQERDLFSEGPVFTIIWRAEANWPIDYISRNVPKILGYSPDEVINSDFKYADIIHPDDIFRIFDEVMHNINNNIDFYEQSYRLRLKNGEYRWFYDFTMLLRNEKGDVSKILGYLFDQTHLKTIEQTLTKERERLNNIIIGTNVGTWEWNVQTGETIFNERWAEIIGYQLEELQPVSINTWAEYAHPEDLIESGKLLEKHFSKEIDYYHFESRMKHKNGEWIWVLDRGKVFEWDSEGKPLWMSGTHQDITIQKNAEAAIKLRESYLSAIIENQPGLVWLKDTESRFLIVNGLFAKATGKTNSEELIGKSDFDFWDYDLAHKYINDDLEVLNSNTSRIVEEMIEVDGNRLWFETFKKPVLGPNGVVIGTTGFAQDITERKISEEKLKNSEHFQRSLMENISVGVIIIDPITRQIESVNKFATQLIGASEEQIINRRCHKFVCTAMENSCPICDFNQNVDNSDRILIRFDGTELPVLKTVKRIYLNGKEKLLESFIDISDRKAAEYALKESESKLNALFSAMTEMLVLHELVFDNEGTPINYRIIDCNDAFLRVTELKRENVVGKLATDVYQTDQAPYFYVYKSVALSGEPISFETYYEDMDKHFMISVVSPYKNHFATITQDITEIKIAEIKLRERDILLKKLSEQIPGVIYQFQYFPDGRSLLPFASDYIWNVFEVSSDEVKSDASIIFSRIHRDDLSRVTESILDSYRNLTLWEVDYRVVLPQKGERWLSGIAKPEPQSDESVLWYGYIHDITDRKNADLELIRVKEQFALAVDGSNDGIWDWDLINNHLYLSPKWKEMLGYRDDELPNSFDTFETNLHPEDKERVFAEINKYLNCESEIYEVEFRFRTKTGDYLWILGRGKAIRNDDGKPYRMAGSHSNITDRKNAEEALQKFARDIEWANWELQNEISIRKETEDKLKVAVEEAQRANRAKSEFLANMSHEIRTPMNSILGFSEVMLGSVSDERHRDYLNTILSSGKTLLSIINDILDLSKIEADKMQVTAAAFDCRLLARDMEKIFENKIAEKGLTFELVFSSSFPSQIVLDELRLRQVLINLLGNAVKFTHSGFVRLEMTVRSMRETNFDFSIHVADSGIGIAEDDSRRIFDAFSQQSGQDTKRYGGTGLGLAISRKLTELMGGSLTLESEYGRGSVFSMHFDNVEYSNESIQNNIEDDNIGLIEFLPSTLLLVDDIKQNRDLIVSYLESQAIRIIQAENGRQAVSLCKELKPDIVLLDIRMPEMNGYEAVKIFKSMDETRDIPIVAFTASIMQSEEDEVKSLFDAYLRKPIRKSELFSCFKMFLKYSEDLNTELSATSFHSNDKDIQIISSDASLSKEFNENVIRKINDLLLLTNPDDISDFANILYEFAHTNNLPSLSNEAQTILKNIECFDFEKVERSITNISKLFSEVKNV